MFCTKANAFFYIHHHHTTFLDPTSKSFAFFFLPDRPADRPTDRPAGPGSSNGRDSLGRWWAKIIFNTNPIVIKPHCFHWIGRYRIAFHHKRKTPAIFTPRRFQECVGMNGWWMYWYKLRKRAIRVCPCLYVCIEGTAWFRLLTPPGFLIPWAILSFIVYTVCVLNDWAFYDSNKNKKEKEEATNLNALWKAKSRRVCACVSVSVSVPINSSTIV